MNLILHTAVTGSVMILFAAVFRVLFAKRLHKRTFPVLWNIIALKLLIPVSLPVSISFYPLFGTQTITEKSEKSIPRIIPHEPPVTPVTSIPAEHFTPSNSTSLGGVTEIPQSVPAASSWNISRSDVLTTVWIVGIVLLALYFAVNYVRCMRQFRESLPINGSEYIDKWLAKHKLSCRKISVRSFDRIISPLTYGIFRPVILLPSNFEELSEDELNIILTHEYVHIKRFDTAFKLVLNAALCVHWFNPLVWLMIYLANKDVEIACDEAVLHKLGGSERQTYANTLIHMEELKKGITAAAAHFGKSALEERIIAIMKYKKPTILTIALSAFFVIGVGSTAAFAVTPKTEDSGTVHEPKLTVTTSEPVSKNNSTDNSEPDSDASKHEPSNEDLTGKDSIWSEPDENGISYHKNGHFIRVPVIEVRPGSPCNFKTFSGEVTLDEKGKKHIFIVRLDNIPIEYNGVVYSDKKFAIISNYDCGSLYAEDGSCKISLM